MSEIFLSNIAGSLMDSFRSRSHSALVNRSRDFIIHKKEVNNNSNTTFIAAKKGKKDRNSGVRYATDHSSHP